MNSFAWACRLLCRNFQRSCFIIHNKSLVRTPCSVKTNLLIGLVPLVPSVYAQSDGKPDSNNVAKPTEDVKASSQEESSSPEENNDGWERLRAIFEEDEYGTMSKELTMVIQSTCMACLVGLCYGGFINSRVAFIDFMERNQASIFENHLDAKRRLQNHVSVHFGKGAFFWAVKLSSFTAGFTLFLSCMSAYRGKSSVMDYTLSGAVVGGLLRLRLGPPAVAVGGIMGGVLGLVCGLTTFGLLNLFDSSLDEVIAFQYEIDRSRHKLYLQAEKLALDSSMNNENAVALLNEREIGKDQKEL